MLAVFETCFRDRGIDQLCMKHVLEIGVLTLGFFPLFRFVPSVGNFLLSFLLISPLDYGLFLCPHLSTLPLIYPFYTISSPASFYVQIGLDNLERPLAHSPSPCAQVRGLIGLLFVDN